LDPLTQGLVATTLPQSLVKKTNIGVASACGFFAGLAPDIDVFIRSSEDPLLFLEYHRQFTHSLIFIPLGGFICAFLLYYLTRRWINLTFKQALIFCTIGYSTHALLDACTTYGTMLFWPFSDERIAWNTISIIDPLFTLPILTLVVFSIIKKNQKYAHIALIWIFGYMALGFIQRENAIDLGRLLAEGRGHNIIRIDAKPSFANILVWKIVYETKEKFYVDAVRAGISPKIFEGNSLLKLDVKRDFAWLDPKSQQAKDIKRFSWFSNGYVAVDPVQLNSIIDVRFSTVPNEIKALWAIKLSKNYTSKSHVIYETSRGNIRLSFKKLYKMLFF
tara:strand:+ start:282 stop:1280 length:999 start_codon:yes stop_codon:yes gene_type:complete